VLSHRSGFRRLTRTLQRLDLGNARFEPAPWLGLSLALSLGTDPYPTPFGMVEAGVSFAIPVR